MQIHLIRHTAPQIEKGTCYGQSDIPLATTFYSDSESLLTHLSKEVDAVYSSPSNRCVRLAGLMNPTHAVTLDKRLMEMNFGNWEMKKWEEIEPQELNKWMADFVNEKTPQGECFKELYQRVELFFYEKIILHQDKNSTIAVVTHAGVIRSILCRVLEIPLHNAFKIPVDYGSDTLIHIDRETYYQRIGYINKLFSSS